MTPGRYEIGDLRKLGSLAGRCTGQVGTSPLVRLGRELIELRTAPQGHPAYRRICQMMHRAIAEVAEHRVIAYAMQFADHSEVELERLQAERAMEKKRR